MKRYQFSIKIDSPKEKVWKILWEDKTFRDWSNLIDEGTYMLGELKEGAKVQFISGSSGYGVTSLVEELSENQKVVFRQLLDTKDSGENERDPEWSGSLERYSLLEENGITRLKVEIDLPEEQIETFKISLPKALDRIKFLSENFN